MSQPGSLNCQPHEVPPFGRLLWASFIGCALVAGMLPLRLAAGASEPGPAQYLVVSEIVTGGASASDELIELFNPTADPASLAALEVVYVSASGTTVTRRVAWSTDAPIVPPGGHVLLANEAGAYADIGDFLYSAGIAAGGGSIALRAEGASTAIDVVGWGSAVAWLEGARAPAPAAGSSIERLPGGTSGSWQDTDDNAHDFIERAVPDPRGLSSPPLAAAPPPPVAPPSESANTPSESPTPAPSATTPGTASPSAASPSAAPLSPSAAATPSPATAPVPIDVARRQPSGAVVTIEGVALTAHDFGDGGGYVADASGGIAVLVEPGVSFAAGARLRVTGPISDRFSQRTVRPEAAGVEPLGAGVAPEAIQHATGSIGEDVEGRLVRLDATIRGGATVLSAATAFEADDGSGPIRVLVGTSTGIDTAAWQPGARIVVIGAVGQRDSSGTGTQGYRVQPRSASDVVAFVPAATPSPTPAPGTPSPAASAAEVSGAGDLVTIALARQAPVGASLTVRGVVTMPPGIVEPDAAFIQDATAGIMLRLADGTPALRAGQLIVAEGVRSTRAGMATIRLTDAPRLIGEQAPPRPHRLQTGGASEAVEGNLVVAIGTLERSARRASSGTVSFDIDDGSGPLRVVLPAALGADDDPLVASSIVEVVGVLGQETTGAAPEEGYRVWPVSSAGVRVVAAVPVTGAEAETGSNALRGFAAPPPDPDGGTLDVGAATLDGVVGPAEATALRVGATIVALDWPELGVGGVLWDGEQLAAVSLASADALRDGVGGRPIPIGVVLTGLAPDGVLHDPQLELVALTRGAAGVSIATDAAAPPRAGLPEAGQPSAWVALTGRLVIDGDSLVLELGAERVLIVRRCDDALPVTAGIVTATGIGTSEPRRIVVPCDGLRPAPVLGGAVPRDSAGAGSTTSGRGDATTPTPTVGAAGEPRRAVAGALLLTGMTGLLAGVVAARRLAHSGRAGDDPIATADDLDAHSGLAASGIGPGDDEANGVAEEPGPDAASAPARPRAPDEAPHLTLLTLPRNRGSP